MVLHHRPLCFVGFPGGEGFKAGAEAAFGHKPRVSPQRQRVPIAGGIHRFPAGVKLPKPEHMITRSRLTRIRILPRQNCILCARPGGRQHGGAQHDSNARKNNDPLPSYHNDTLPIWEMKKV